MYVFRTKGLAAGFLLIFLPFNIGYVIRFPKVPSLRKRPLKKKKNRHRKVLQRRFFFQKLVRRFKIIISKY